MTKREIIQEDTQESLIFWDGLDEAIVGLTLNGNNTVVVYDYDSCINCLMVDGMNNIDAIEYFDYNVLGAFVGELTPQIIRTIKWDNYYQGTSLEMVSSKEITGIALSVEN